MVDGAEYDYTQRQRTLSPSSNAIVPSRCASMIDTAIVVVDAGPDCGFNVSGVVSCELGVKRERCRVQQIFRPYC